MTRLNWDARGERFFETGVDRGVLYVGNNVGVAWPGLISVGENPSGGEPRPYYIDGVKYLNLSSAEEFQATIAAFSSPKEFGVCDGEAAIQNGLFVTQQPRKAFNFSYRTQIGNDIEGKAHGYKIHLVYNALAGPSSRTNSTVASETEPGSLSWEITTLPPSLTGRKPTSHFVIDSRSTPKGLLNAIEDILYGSAAAQPRMPLVSELVTLFKSPGPVVRTNILLQPLGPSMTSTAGWRPSSSESITMVTDEDGLRSIEARDDVGGGAMYVDPSTSFADPSWVGKWFAMGVDIRPLDYYSAIRMRININPYAGVSIQKSLPTYRDIPIDQYTRFSEAVRIDDMAIGTSGYIRALIWPPYVKERFPDEKLLDSEAWGGSSGNIGFSGAGSGADGTTDGSMLINSSVNQEGRFYKMSSKDASPMVVPGEEIIVSAKFRGSSAVPIGGAIIYVRFYSLSSGATEYPAVKSVTNPVEANSLVWTTFSGVVTAPTSGGPDERYYAVMGLYKPPSYTNGIRFSTPSIMSRNRFRFRNAVISVADTEAEALASVAKPLSGDLPPVDGRTYEWVGPANAAPSVEKTWHLS